MNTLNNTAEIKESCNDEIKTTALQTENNKDYQQTKSDFKSA